MVILKLISLNNVDTIILTALLARQLQKVLPYIIHPAQSGFIKNRQASYNLHLLLDMPDIAQDRMDPAVLVFLDTELAFDKVQIIF